MDQQQHDAQGKDADEVESPAESIPGQYRPPLSFDIPCELCGRKGCMGNHADDARYRDRR